MSDFCFSTELSRLFSSECFREATTDELRVLLALISENRKITDADAISTLSGVSRARVLSAITLFREAGVIRELDAFAEIADEYSNNEKPRDSAVRVARDIRDEGLAELIEECAKTMKRASLSAEEVKAIHSLYADKALSAEYIVTLAAYLEAKQKNGEPLPVRKLVREGEKLASRGVETLEELELYLDRQSKTSSEEWEFRRLVGIYKRNLSSDELRFVKRWWGEFGFSAAIVGEAFNIATKNTNDAVSLPYMDTVLEAWHRLGCTTVEECREASEKYREELRERKTESTKPARKKADAAAEVPKYSTFNSEDALMNALLRSYGDKDDK